MLRTQTWLCVTTTSRSAAAYLDFSPVRGCRNLRKANVIADFHLLKYSSLLGAARERGRDFAPRTCVTSQILELAPYPGVIQTLSTTRYWSNWRAHPTNREYVHAQDGVESPSPIRQDRTTPRRKLNVPNARFGKPGIYSKGQTSITKVGTLKQRVIRADESGSPNERVVILKTTWQAT